VDFDLYADCPTLEDAGLDWLATEALYATPLSPRDDAIAARILVTDAGRLHAVMLVEGEPGSGYPEGERTWMANGELINWRDDYPVLLGLVDEVYASAMPGEEIYIEAVED
jgi:hypothetical protein